RRYASLADDITAAASAYALDVKARRFPAAEHTYAVRPVSAA
ncbi:MAG: 3-methyl-2-oxobutanoate hydroxymethyltransferase, partial [Alphaproteobacteria bacterium]|nr:3-methyl-2-oxobutanoate hydroxymethyltransferase [Alphaproteobacteria bacterium]